MALRPLLVLAVVFAAALDPGAAAPDYDCNAGCPLSGEGVCGKDGVTYVNDCVRECAGNTPRDYSGACDPPGTPPSTGGPKSPFPLAETVLGSYIKTPVSVIATKAQMTRFSAEGLTLIGAANMVLPQGTKAAGPGGSNVKPSVAGPDTAAPGITDDLEVYEIRVAYPGAQADIPLVYASKPLRTTIRDVISTTPPSKATPGWQPGQQGAAAGAAPRAGDAQDGPLLLSAGRAEGAAAAVEASAGIINALDDPWWKMLPNFTRITSNEGYPYTTIGQISGVDAGGNPFSCTGALVGPAMVLTAAQCVWNRDYRALNKNIVFTPHMYCPKTGVPLQCTSDKDLVYPYGQAEVDTIFIRDGYKRRNGARCQRYRSDIALLYLRGSPIGYRMGWVGFGYTRGSFSTQLYTAGEQSCMYTTLKCFSAPALNPCHPFPSIPSLHSATGFPNDNTLWNEYYRLSGPCSVRDAFSRDRMLKFKQYPDPPRGASCLTSCAVSRGGQAGQPAWFYYSGGGYFNYPIVWGTLLYGPAPVSSCQGKRSAGFDTYSQFDELDYLWINKSHMMQPCC